MIACNKCRTEMRCYKTGIVLSWRGEYCKKGDAYECQECGARVTYVRDTTSGYNMSEKVGDYLDMKEEG